MFKNLLFLAGLLFLTASPAAAQNTTCATRAPGDSSNACASTAFVQTAVPAASVINIINSPYNAKCDGTTDNAAVINAALVAASTTTQGGYVLIPSGYTCAFGSTINLQQHTTLEIMPGAILKFIGTSGDEILGVADGNLHDRMNIIGPGEIDATNATSGVVIHYEGGIYDVINNIYVVGNSTSLTVLQINGNTNITGGAGNFALGLVDGLFATGTISRLITLEGTVVAGPTNNSFYNVMANIGAVVAGQCIYAPRENDTEYFYNVNCAEQSTGIGIVLGASTGQSFTVGSGTYNSTTGATTITVPTVPSAVMMQVGDQITVANLTGTGGFAGLNGNWTITAINGHNISWTATTGLGASTITGGNFAITFTDTFGFHFVNYITSGGAYSVALYETTDDSFMGGNDGGGATNPGITNFTGPAQGALSLPARYVACHSVSNYNIDFMCASHLPYTVGTLPAGSQLEVNDRVYVTDATSCTFMGSLTGGGSTFCPVVWNGSAWVGG